MMCRVPVKMRIGRWVGYFEIEMLSKNNLCIIVWFLAPTYPRPSKIGESCIGDSSRKNTEIDTKRDFLVIKYVNAEFHGYCNFWLSLQLESYTLEWCIFWECIRRAASFLAVENEEWYFWCEMCIFFILYMTPFSVFLFMKRYVLPYEGAKIC